jgi:antirestriction protein ArdC
MRRSRKLTHWTGHKSRLDRGFGVHRLGSNAYAQEELVAELGAAFICADLELTLVPREDHASYIANWFEVLKNDNRAVFTPPRTRSAPRISSTRRARS